MRQTCEGDKLGISLPGMKRVLICVLLVAMVVLVSGCCNGTGSREFIPGKGWVPND